MGMDMAARAMAKGAEQRAVKQGSTKLAAADKRIFSLPNAADGALSVEGVKGKTLQNHFTKDGFGSFQAGSGSTTGDYATITTITEGFEMANVIVVTTTPTLKPNTTYTIFFGELPFNPTNITVRDNDQGINLKGGNTEQNKLTFTTPNIISSNLRIYYNRLKVGDKIRVKNNMLCLEGDWTNKEIPPYFEGIKSVGEDTGKLSVKSTGSNFFNPEFLDFDGYVINKYQGSYYGKEYKLKSDTTYTISFSSDFSNVLDGEWFVINVWDYTINRNKQVVNINKATYTTNSNDTVTFKTDSLGRFGLSIFKQRDAHVLKGKLKDGMIKEQATTPYEPYKESKIEIPLTEPLRSLPNGVSDEIKDGKIIRRVGVTTLRGTFEERWNTDNPVAGLQTNFAYPNSLRFKTTTHNNHSAFIVDKLSPGGPSFKGYWNTAVFVITLPKSETGVVEGDSKEVITEKFKNYVSANPITVYYELITPIETPITIPAINSFTNGMVTIENNIWPSELTISYSTNVVARVINAESTLSGVLASTLTLADKELAMKSLTTLATGASLTDAVNKVNQILNIWR